MESNTEQTTDKAVDIQEQVKAQLEEIRRKQKESGEALREGKGRLRLEKPIKAMDEDIEELVSRGVRAHMGMISEQVLQKLEKKLRNEKSRRGI